MPTLTRNQSTASTHIKAKSWLSISEPLEQISEKEKLINKFIRFAGPSGKYQMLIFYFSLVVLFAGGFPIYLVSYLSPDPIAECPTDDSGASFGLCTEKEACDLRDAGKPHKLYFKGDSWSS